MFQFPNTRTSDLPICKQPHLSLCGVNSVNKLQPLLSIFSVYLTHLEKQMGEKCFFAKYLPESLVHELLHVVVINGEWCLECFLINHLRTIQHSWWHCRSPLTCSVPCCSTRGEFLIIGKASNEAYYPLGYGVEKPIICFFWTQRDVSIAQVSKPQCYNTSTIPSPGFEDS